MVYTTPGFYAYPSIFSGVILILIAIWTLTNLDEQGATGFIGMMLAMSGWAIFNGANLLAETHTWKLFYLYMTFVSVFAIPPLWVLFSLQFTNNMKWWTTKLKIPIIGGSIFFILLSATNEYHYAFMGPRALVSEPFLMLDRQELTLEQPMYIAAYAYSYTCVIGANFLLMRLGLSSGRLHKNQIMLLLIGLFIPMWLGIFTAINWTPISGLDLVPYGIGIWGIILGYVYHRHNLFDITPIARERIIRDLRDPMITIDHKGRVTDWNKEAEPLFDDQPSGADFSEAAPDELLAALAKVGIAVDDHNTNISSDGAGKVDEQVNNVPLTINGTEHIYNIRVTIINKGEPRSESKVILMRNITKLVEQRKEIKEKKEELERQNERLDNFAGVLAHDLRSPLGTARGFLDLYKETDSEDHFTKVSDAHVRMENMIDDLLTLAQQGEEVSEKQDVDLKSCVSEAWNMVETHDGTLQVETDQTINADPSRISNLFENLIRNSFDHVGKDTTVYIGEIEDGEGFFFADDGPGIPDKHKDSIFEYGYTTNKNGSGFGLNIVKEIVEAHNWSLSLDETDEYGAKFDIRFDDPEQ